MFMACATLLCIVWICNYLGSKLDWETKAFIRMEVRKQLKELDEDMSKQE
jgi:hypothetical protein